MLEPRPLYNITHPFIDSIYIKNEFDAHQGDKPKDILVIETVRIDKNIPKIEREKMLLSFLADLEVIKNEVEKKVGKFNRVDIRYH